MPKSIVTKNVLHHINNNLHTTKIIIYLKIKIRVLFCTSFFNGLDQMQTIIVSSVAEGLLARRYTQKQREGCLNVGFPTYYRV